MDLLHFSDSLSHEPRDPKSSDDSAAAGGINTAATTSGDAEAWLISPAPAAASLFPAVVQSRNGDTNVKVNDTVNENANGGVKPSSYVTRITLEVDRIPYFIRA